MDITLSTFEESVQKAFIYIMTAPSYAQKRWKRTRILFFAYMFGCVHVDDLNCIFYDENANLNVSSKESIKNNHRNTLNYLYSKNGYLKNIRHGFYCISASGIKELFSILHREHFFSFDEFGVFERSCRNKSIRPLHASMNGRAVLSFIRCFPDAFLVDPNFDSKARRTDSFYPDASSHVITPDAVIMDHKRNELYFIETDSCEERKNTSLIPKFLRYTDTFQGKQAADTRITIQFSIYKNKEPYQFPDTYDNTVREILALYDFISESLSCPTDFKDFLTSLADHSPDEEPLLHLSHFLNEQLDEEVSSKRHFIDLFSFKNEQILFNKSYFTRRKLLYSCISQLPSLLHFLLQGNRLIAIPLCENEVLYKYLYFEKFSYSIFIENYIRKQQKNISFIAYYNRYKFNDETSGNCIVFCNVYVVKIDGVLHYYILENISEDLGANVRINNILQYIKSFDFTAMHFVCIYNEINHKNASEIISKFKENGLDISFLSHKNFFDMLVAKNSCDTNCEINS